MFKHSSSFCSTADKPISTIDSSVLYDPGKAAAFLGITIETLAVWRCTKRYNLPYIKVGRLVKYRVADLLAFLESRRVST